MAIGNWNLEASEELVQRHALQEEARRESVFGNIMDILSKDKSAQDMITRLNLATNASGLTKEQYQKAKETVFLIATLNNPEAFQALSNSVWNKINDHQVGADLARYMGV